MRITEWLLPPNPCKSFENNKTLFEGLYQQENRAILCVQWKALNAVRKFVKQYGLPGEMADDILNQSTLIFLRKIEEGSYQFQDNAPSTYLIEIARRVALSATRSLKNTPESLEKYVQTPDPDLESELRHKEAVETVKQLLDRLGDPCEQVVRLHHIDGYSDEEVISGKMTRYTTADSLKMKRSDCMKKLIQLAQQWKISNNT